MFHIRLLIAALVLFPVAATVAEVDEASELKSFIYYSLFHTSYKSSLFSFLWSLRQPRRLGKKSDDYKHDVAIAMIGTYPGAEPHQVTGIVTTENAKGGE